ncbi:hypothetical protein S101450_00717 [Komagataeibacter saccharivorans]|nr:hypothetical protein S101450_00717 [Komagataeibacter saccharivorans]
MVFDAHDRGFAFFKGGERGIYDNMKTVVETVSVGRARDYNRRFFYRCASVIWLSRRPVLRLRDGRKASGEICAWTRVFLV